MKKTGVLFILMALIGSCAATEIPSDIRLITEDSAPYNFVDNGTLQGISVDLMEEILQKMGSNLTRRSMQILPWTEGCALARTNPDTILFSTVRLPEREHELLWVGPVITDSQVLFVSHANQSEPENLSTLRIVVVTDDCARHYALAAGADEEHITNVTQVEDAVRMVENGSADAWAYDELAGERSINRYAKDPSTFRVEKELGESDYYLSFNPETSPELVSAVNTTLQTLKTDRSRAGVTEYERILAKYMPVRCAPVSSPPEKVTELVNRTAEDMARDAPGTIASINEGKNPYQDLADPELYVFVFDPDIYLLANAATTQNIGKNLAGMTDAYGYPFRDEMVRQARENKTGWISYVYSNPKSLGLYQKMSYFHEVTGSDGNEYIVGAGRYRTCNDTSSTGN